MSYERQRDRLREELTLAEMELSQVVVEQLDVESILGFAEIVLTDTARLWSDAGLNEKQLLQQAIFPEGLRFDGERFGTAVTCLAFKQLELSFEAKSEVASPKGIEYFYTLVGSALKACVGLSQCMCGVPEAIAALTRSVNPLNVVGSVRRAA